MKKITLTNGLNVSEICLGTMEFGTKTDKQTAFRLLDAYVDAGGNFLDTSNNYAHWLGSGDESETVLGEWFSERKKRDSIVLATKVGYDRHGEGAGLKREQIEHWCDESLGKLKTDYIDLYYAHVDDPDTPLEETMEAFDNLVKKGKVRKLGGSNYDTWRFAEAREVSREHGWESYGVMQQRFSYLYTREDRPPFYPFNEYVNRERMRYLTKYQIPLVAYSCLCKGGYELPERIPEENITGERLETLKSMAYYKGVTASELVIAWMLALERMPGFTRVIPLFGSSSVEHLLANLSGAEIVLTDEEMEVLCRA